MPEEQLLAKTTHHFSAMALINYPAVGAPLPGPQECYLGPEILTVGIYYSTWYQVGAPLLGQLRCGAHADSGTLTIVWEDGCVVNSHYVMPLHNLTMLLHNP